MTQESNLALQVLKKALLKQGYELISSGKKNKDGIIAIEANKLQPIQIKQNEVIYMPIPVNLVVKADSDNIKIIKGNSTPQESILDAENFAKMLVDNNKLEGIPEIASDAATHSLEINENGQKIIRRRRFDAF